MIQCKLDIIFFMHNNFNCVNKTAQMEGVGYKINIMFTIVCVCIQTKCSTHVINYMIVYNKENQST